MAGEIPFRQAAFTLQIEEVGFLDRVKQRDNAQPRRLVNNAVDIGEFPKRLAHA